MSLPLPNIPAPLGSVEQPPATTTEMNVDEYGFILDSTLSRERREDPTVLAFIDAFLKSRNIAQASAECGIHSSIGRRIRHYKDVANAIQKLTDVSFVKYGFDASEIIERTKEIVDFDPIELVNPDGSYKSNLADISPEARRNLKKMKVKNLWAESEDINGVKTKIIVGEIIEYEFFDKLKAVELVGREKDLFKQTNKIEHTVSNDMARLLLESRKRGDDAAKRLVEIKADRVVDHE